jgi:hypothetical protein
VDQREVQAAEAVGRLNLPITNKPGLETRVFQLAGQLADHRGGSSVRRCGITAFAVEIELIGQRHLSTPLLHRLCC